MSITSPFRSSSDLITKVLGILGVLSVGQPIDPEDFGKVNDNIDSIFRKIAGLEIAYVSDANNIPGAWFMDLSAIVAGEMASDFGLVGQELIDKVNAGLGGKAGVEIGAGAAAKSLKITMRGRPTYETLRIMNF